MKFSENWLRQHVSLEADSAALEQRLTAIGLEVEGVERQGEGLDGVVVARILSCEKHPQADRLQVCQVDAGQGEPLQIVCGAPNARAGLVAPLAVVGARVGEITIKAAKLRGVASNGMLCSAKELGVDADASGLMELPDDAPVGTALAGYLGLPDNVIELGLTPNRADCLGLRGLAYDVAAAFGAGVSGFEPEPVPAASEAALGVELHAGADAPRYLGRVIEGVDARMATPVWMAERLRRGGIRPVSFLVDVTQYVMLELGQPMHAFDRDLLKGPVGVRHAHAGGQPVLLDGREVGLDAGFLAVTDADRVVALAGLMGGQDTKVSDATRNVFLESAHFAPTAIAGRSRRLGLHTDAAHRFERGVDPELPRAAMEAATRLILQVAGGTPGPVTEAVLPEHLPKPAPIVLRRERLARVLGVRVDDSEVGRILRALGLTVEDTADGWLASPPSWRFDLAIEEDLIEEVARIHGYDRVPTTLPGGATRVVAATEGLVEESDLRRHMVGRDWLEAVNFAFVDAQLLDSWQLQDGAVPLANPLSAELGVMRTALLPGLVEALGRNAARQQPRVRLFEIGRAFAAAAAGEAPVETPRIAAVAIGDARAEQWGDDERPVDFHDLKGDLDSLAACAGARLQYRPSQQPHGHPGRSADVYRDDQRIGWIGELHPRLLRALDLDHAAVGFEVDLEPLRRRALPRLQALGRFPSVRRDLAFVVPEAVTWAAIETSIHTVAGPLLVGLGLFDVYAGKGVESGFKSLAMGLILQEKSRTLTEQDVEEVVQRVTDALQHEHGARIRS